MVNVETYINEFIGEEDIDEKEFATIQQEPNFPTGQAFKSLVADVKYKGEVRKLNINKGNADRLSKAWGMDSKKWSGQKVRIRKPTETDKAKSGTKFILDPISSETQKAERIARLKANGVSDEAITKLEAAGEL